MKILRSQYLELQRCMAKGEQHSSNSGAAAKVIPSKGKEHCEEKAELELTTAQTRHLGKKDIVCFDGNSSTPPTNIKILIENSDGSLKNLNVVLEYVDMSTSWWTNVYKTYENDLWRKKPYLDIHGKQKWLFYCSLCTNTYKEFYSMKCHLNMHLNLHPYVCKICLKKYTGRKAIISHLKKFHHLERHQYNDNLTS